MADKLMRNVALLIKQESVYGTDPVPAAGTNAILAQVSNAQPVQTQFEERQNVKSYLGSSGSIQVAAWSTITVQFELAGSSGTGTAPPWGPLIEACGFAEVATPATDVVYTPVSTGFESVTIYYYLDGLLHKMTGAFGNPTFTINSRGIPVSSVDFTGLYNATADASIPGGVDYSAFQTPQAVNNTNTTAFSLHGASPVLDTFSISVNNTVPYQNMVGEERVSITDRRMSANASFKMTSVATKAWHNLIRAGTTGALALTHGTTAGSIFDFDAPAAQLKEPSYSDKDGVVMLNLGMDLLPDSGNDELVITVT
ncbi:hypothetical protein SAMN05216302_101435 [Nitrosomonas aestuarii]|uniref:Uncharacterized protein n=1 Tax=Nitrosomonas aestuarii TaxID=52441 RepID=A0A1I4C046_9PROT|nr:phage tail tube protein [Nitrosomonas aestuarii]SFK74432.1 hypothetical protein SAMN05216302_101435 [Nitrosomonas aestuarii]